MVATCTPVTPRYFPRPYMATSRVGLVSIVFVGLARFLLGRLYFNSTMLQFTCNGSCRVLKILASQAAKPAAEFWFG